MDRLISKREERRLLNTAQKLIYSEIKEKTMKRVFQNQTMKLMKLLDRRDCLELPGSLSFRGVCSFSKSDFGGLVIEREIGCNPKRTFFLAANEGGDCD